MKVNRSTFVLSTLLFICGLAVGFAQQLDVDSELEEAKSLYREARFAKAIVKLKATVERLEQLRDLQARRIQLSDAHLHLALSYVALNDSRAAKESLQQMLRADRSRRLDPDVYAPKVIALFDEAKKEVAAEPAAAAPPTPSATAKKGGSRLPLIILGAGGAAAAGVAVATGGGGFPSGTTPSAPGGGATGGPIPIAYGVALIGADPPQGSQLRAGIDNRVTLMFLFDIAAGERVVATMFLGQGQSFDNRCFNFAETTPFSPGSAIAHTQVITLPSGCPPPKTFSVNVVLYKESLARQTGGIVHNAVFGSFYTLD